MNDNSKLTIGFHCTTLEGFTYDATSTVEVFFDFGENELDVIGQQLNVFLQQMGYARKNDYIFMRDISEDEYEAIEDFLKDYRANQS